MDRHQREMLDRHITGNYGEDQFLDDEWPDDPECQMGNCHKPAVDGVLCQQHLEDQEVAEQESEWLAQKERQDSGPHFTGCGC